MKKILWLVMMASGLCCGSSGSTAGAGGATATATTAGPGGGGGAAAASSSASTATTTTGGGGGTPDVEIGVGTCAWKETVIAPLLGEAKDANGNPIDEDGAIPALQVVPPSYPFTLDRWTYVLRAGIGPCAMVPHSAVAFVGPAADGADPPAHPPASSVRKEAIDPAKLTWKNGIALVTVTLDPPVVLQQGEALWIGPKLAVDAKGRVCVLACDGGGADPRSWFSTTNATGDVDDCPAMLCSFKELAHSPTDALAAQYGNTSRRWLMTAAGHP